MKIRDDEAERIAEYISDLEAELESYRDEAAEWKLKYKAAKAELLRVKATLEVA